MPRDLATPQRTKETVAPQAPTTPAVPMLVVQVWEGVIVAPLIGLQDSRHTQQFMERLLHAIMETQARVVLIDVTEVPTIDTPSAQHLLKTMMAVRLLGAEVVVTGIRPALAHILLQLGLDLSHLVTRPSLADGLRVALDRLGLQVISKNERS